MYLNILNIRYDERLRLLQSLYKPIWVQILGLFVVCLKGIAVCTIFANGTIHVGAFYPYFKTVP